MLFRELEQSLILLTRLDHKPVAKPAADLLAHQHPKVLVAAAWTLRILQVEETFPLMLERAEEISNVLMADQMNHPLYSSVHMDQVAHLFDSFGVSVYKPAEKLMRSFAQCHYVFQGREVMSNRTSPQLLLHIVILSLGQN